MHITNTGWMSSTELHYTFDVTYETPSILVHCDWCAIDCWEREREKKMKY